MNAKTHPVIIIGSGPAGLTAEIYTARANLHPLVFEGKNPGGQLMGTTTVDNWPGSPGVTGPKLMITMQQQAKNAGAELIQEETYWGKGVSTCTICDGALYRNQNLIVVGGGDGAMESALFLKSINNNVTIVHILDKLTASYAMQERVLKENIKIIYQHTLTEIHGDGKRITKVTIQNQTDQSQQELETEAVFLAIGARPNSGLCKGHIELTNYGHIKTHDFVKTSTPGVFAAGDVHDPKYRQAIVSAGFGCIAALEAQRHLENHTP